MSDLLAGLTDDTKMSEGEVVDLLAGIDADGDAKAWRPEPGQGIQGVVVKLGSTKSDYTPDPIPVVTVRTDEGELFRVTGYQTVLRREIEDAAPRVGGRFAAKYFGLKDAQKAGAKPYHHYKAAASAPTAPTAPLVEPPVPF
jgi:hypothetical protein